MPHAAAEPVEWPQSEGGNGHFYEAFMVTGLCSWEEARSWAEGMVWKEEQGYLVTITSAGEQEWIWDQFGEINFYWLGGYQDSGSAEPDAGWQWVTGEVWDYTAWNFAEPNDSTANMDGYEDRLQIGEGPRSGWNDLWPSALVPGYIVEFNPPQVGTSASTWSRVKALFSGSD